MAIRSDLLSPALRTTPKAVLFDWDDTLFDHEPLVERQMNSILRYLSPVNPPEYKQFHEEWILDHEAACQHHFGISNDELSKIWDQFYREIPLEDLSLLSDVENVLIQLKEKGIRLGIISNKPDDYLLRELEHFKLRDYFEVIEGQHTDKDKRKPSDYTVNEAIRKLGIASEHIWYVGDTLEDMQAARKLQRFHIHLSETHQERVKGKLGLESGEKPIISLKNLADFMKFVDLIPNQAQSLA